MGTWIEIKKAGLNPILSVNVVPYVGTWIEICFENGQFLPDEVVPYVGTWIEISLLEKEEEAKEVVPYVGTWIEI